MLHPKSALHAPYVRRVFLPVCEHFAGSERFLSKAFALQDQGKVAFDVTADLEDGAATGSEEGHAAHIAEILTERIGSRNREYSHRTRVGLRIHDVRSSWWRKDLEIVLPKTARGLAYITVPKLTSVAELEQVARVVAWHARQAGRDSSLPLHVLIETPQALAQVNEIAAHPAVEVLDFGLLDFISELEGVIPAEAMRSPLQFDHALINAAKIAIVQAACATGKVASHNICVDISSPERVRSDASRARRQYGFQRMWSIHPSQIAPIIEAMNPDFSHLALAQAVLRQGYESAWGPIRHEGTLHDRASYRHFWSVVQQAQASGLPLDPDLVALFFAE